MGSNFTLNIIGKGKTYDIILSIQRENCNDGRKIFGKSHLTNSLKVTLKKVSMLSES